MASRGKGARAKGFQFERDFAKMLTERLGVPFQRGLGQSRAGGTEVCDVYSTEVPWMHIEAKRQKRCSIKGAMKQAVGDVVESGKMPIVITKDDREPIFVTMHFEDWVLMLEAFLSQDSEED